jgi:hypothetical protein
VPVRQSAQVVLFYQKRIARQPVLCRVRYHHTSKNRYSAQKMITKSLYVKNIVKLTQIFKKIVLGVWGEVKMGVVLKKRVVS